MSESGKSPWSRFSSMKLAVALLILIALTSIAGTILPQQESAVDFVRELSPLAQKIWEFMGLADMYRSWWFRLLLAALALNLISCTLDRLPGAIKMYRARLKPDMEKPFENLPGNRAFSAPGRPDDVARAVSQVLSRRCSRTAHKQSGNIHFFAADKGRISIFGVYLVHASVLLILAGALTGSFLGFQAFVNIPEGSAVDTVYLRSTRQPFPLGFSVRCNAFNVEFYDSGSPKEYRSELVFMPRDSEPETHIVRVNHPAVFNGVAFYQSTYGSMPRGLVRLRVSGPGDGTAGETLETGPGTDVPLPGGGSFRIVDMHSNFMDEGAAVLLSVRRPGHDEIQLWIFEHPDAVRSRLPGPMAMSRKFDPSAAEPFKFEFADMSRRYYTGLQANKDPGVPLVWAGCAIMIVGFFLTFFHSHRRIRVRVARSAGGASIEVAAWSNRNPVGLEREVDAIRIEIAGKISTGEKKVSGGSTGSREKVSK